MQSVPGRIPIASDAWTSKNQHAFLALTASWINEDWEMVITLIDFIQLTGSHSGENMAKEAFKTLKELNIKEKASLLSFDYGKRKLYLHAYSLLRIPEIMRAMLERSTMSLSNC